VNGTSCPPKENPFYNKEKELKNLNQLKMRFTLILILSHVISIFLNTNKVEQVSAINGKFKVPSTYSALTLPIKIHFPVKADGMPATLVNENKKILAKKVYITQKKTSDDQTQVVYVSQKDVNQIIQSNEQVFHAYPFNIVPVKKTKRGPYEVVF